MNCPECGSYTKNGCGAWWHDTAPDTATNGCELHGWEPCLMCRDAPGADVPSDARPGPAA